MMTDHLLLESACLGETASTDKISREGRGEEDDTFVVRLLDDGINASRHSGTDCQTNAITLRPALDIEAKVLLLAVFIKVCVVNEPTGRTEPRTMSKLACKCDIE